LACKDNNTINTIYLLRREYLETKAMSWLNPSFLSPSLFPFFSIVVWLIGGVILQPEPCYLFSDSG
jgi:hypothetical protein